MTKKDKLYHIKLLKNRFEQLDFSKIIDREEAKYIIKILKDDEYRIFGKDASEELQQAYDFEVKKL